MFLTLLVLHSLLRWAVLIFGIVAFVRALTGWLGGRAWGNLDDRAGRAFVISFDLQTLMGLILYGGLSPITRAAFSDMGMAMKDPLLRFYAVEHLTLMIVALALAHIGRARTRKLATDAARHRSAAIMFGLSLLATILAIPWPGRTAGRPLFPTF